MINVWMIRAGEGGRLINSFAKGSVAVGWQELGDMSTVSDLEEVRQAILPAYPDGRKGAIGNSVAMFHKFRSVYSSILFSQPPILRPILKYLNQPPPAF